MRLRRLVAAIVLGAVIGYAGLAAAADVGRIAPVLDRILAKKELVVGTAGSMPPLNMTTKDGRIIGIEPDLAAAIAGALNVKLTLKPIAFPNLLAALEAGEVDLVLSSMTITPERNTRVAFAGPYFASGKSVLTSVDSLSKAGSTAQLNVPEATVVALKGSTSQIFVERLMPKANLVLTDDYDQAVAMILERKALAMVADYPICQVSAFRYRDKGLITLEKPLSYEPIGVALSPSDPLLLNLIQNVINGLETSGELKSLAKGWFGNAGSWLHTIK
jgi:polar amino acid transport system substrate-binding protein